MLRLLIGADVLMVLVFVLSFNRLPPQIPLFYSRPLGEAQLADTWMIILIPLLLNILYIINNYLYKRFFTGNDFIKKILGYLLIFLILSLTSVFIRIILLIS